MSLCFLSSRPRHRCLLIILLLLCAADSVLYASEKITVDELVARHLDSIGTIEARSAARSRMSQGTVAFSERISGAVHVEGTAAVISSGSKFKTSFDFHNPQYRGEQFVFDGQKVQIALIDQQSRSALGNFLVTEPEIVEEGLFGGALRVGWPLLDLKASAGKWKFDGTKKIEGHELYELAYTPKKRGGSGDLEIHLYFDPITFHHVMTVYRLTTTPVSTDSSQSTDANIRTTIVEERFDDFHSVDGLTLPSSWDIRLRVEPSPKAQEFEWKVALSSIAHNKL